MSDLRTAAQMALDALENSEPVQYHHEGFKTFDLRKDRHRRAIIALRAALSAEPQPVVQCVVYETRSGDHVVCRTCGEAWAKGRDLACVRARALLARIGAAPTAQPLTDEQMLEILGDIDADTKRLPPGIKAFARAIERAHGIGGTHG